MSTADFAKVSYLGGCTDVGFHGGPERQHWSIVEVPLQLAPTLGPRSAAAWPLLREDSRSSRATKDRQPRLVAGCAFAKDIQNDSLAMARGNATTTSRDTMWMTTHCEWMARLRKDARAEGDTAEGISRMCSLLTLSRLTAQRSKCSASRRKTGMLGNRKEDMQHK